MTIDISLLQRIVEGALLAAGRPLTVADLAALFEEEERPDAEQLRAALDAIAAQCNGRGFELREVASGFRLQVVQEVAPWIARLWEEKPQRYSRALLETLALIAYRQPITRGDIEDIRGVAVASNIVKTLLERDWVRVVGHKDVPGRPAMYATTRRFLDYFNLKNLDDLPALADLRDLDSRNTELALEGVDTQTPDETALDADLQGEGAVVANTVDTDTDTDTDISTDREINADGDGDAAIGSNTGAASDSNLHSDSDLDTDTEETPSFAAAAAYVDTGADEDEPGEFADSHTGSDAADDFDADAEAADDSSGAVEDDAPTIAAERVAPAESDHN